MSRHPNHDILFEPVQIGPVTAKNRFYQVPQCNGMGNKHPTAHAIMRKVKAEGGWAVVCTEESGIHPSADISPYLEMRLWDDRELPALSRLADAVHEHDALAGLELCHSGPEVPNDYSREVPFGPSNQVVTHMSPVQARAMDKQDFRNLRRWHRNAALLGRKAGYDIIYVYAGKFLTLLTYFLSRRFNHRTDEYGGSLENRCRLLRELLQDTREAVGDTCGVVCRVSVDELIGPDGIHKEEVKEMIEMLDDYPDMWDLTLSGWENDSQTSRFAEEAFQEPFVTTIKQISSKPIVGVGRFTSPDTMARQVRQGILDMIGAARPSIADPFLPKKIEEGRLDDIRECIGCNICVASEHTTTPIKCTQNPTMGEEWRRDWHPEYIRAKQSDSSVLIVGAGPAGLECAQALGKRGYEVKLAETLTETGGRVSRECRLPGLNTWIRVRDYRLAQIAKLPNVELYLDSKLDAGQVLEFGFNHIVLATGSHWRRDGIGRQHPLPLQIDQQVNVLTPDDIMDDNIKISGHVVVYDDDHYYLGGLIAEKLRMQGCPVTLVTSAADVSNWTHNTMEQHRIQKRLLELDVNIVPHRAITRIEAGNLVTACVFTGKQQPLEFDQIVLVTSRAPFDVVYHQLHQRKEHWRDSNIESVRLIGDACAPATIAAAIFAGRRYAEDLDAPAIGDAVPFKREMLELAEL